MTTNELLNKLASAFDGYIAGEYCVIEKEVPNKGLIIFRIKIDGNKPIIDAKRYLPVDVPETQSEYDNFEKLAFDFVKELEDFFSKETGEKYEISHDWIE